MRENNNDVPSDIDYKDQGLTPQELRCGERVWSTRQSAANTSPAPVTTRPQPHHTPEEVPSTLEYKDQGLSLMEVQHRRSSQAAAAVPLEGAVDGATSNGDRLPIVQAIPVEEHEDEHDIVLPPQQQQQSMAYPPPLPHAASSPAPLAPAAVQPHHHDARFATFWKRPTETMLQNATQSDAMAGIAFFMTNPRKGGKFTVPKTIHVGHIFSGSRLDLSYADFVYPVTIIRAGNILGGFHLIVPQGVRIETRGLGLLGRLQGLQSQTVHAAQDAPRIVVQGVAILGSIKVSVNMDVPGVRASN